MVKSQACLDFIASLPKAELHVHLEGTLSPVQYEFFARRNALAIPFASQAEIETAWYAFSDLASFIGVYQKAQQVLCTEQDFYDLTMSYLKKAHVQGIVRAEIFFDIQSHMVRGIEPSVVINSVYRACVDAREQWGISAAIIICFLRDLSEDEAFAVLDILDEFRSKIIGIGLASIEKDNPPSKFERVFLAAKNKGYHIVAHAGEECGPDFIRDAIVGLQAERIDHGISCMRDPALVTTLALTQLPMTVCPLSNIALGYASSLATHPVRAMFDAGIMVTINSDDPAFFKGYCSDNYRVLAEQANFTCKELVVCARNSIKASFCTDQEKEQYLTMLDAYAAHHDCTS